VPSAWSICEWRVVVRLEAAYRRLDQGAEARSIGRNGQSEAEMRKTIRHRTMRLSQAASPRLPAPNVDVAIRRIIVTAGEPRPADRYGWAPPTSCRYRRSLCSGLKIRH